MNQKQKYGKNELTAGLVGIVTGLSLLLFTNFWKGIIDLGSYLNTAQILPQTFNVVAYIYIFAFGLVALLSLNELSRSRVNKKTSKQPVTPTTILLRLIVTIGVAYIAAMIAFAVIIGGGPASLALLPVILGFWVFGPIIPLAILLLRIKKVGQPLRKRLLLLVCFSVVAILASAGYAVVQQRGHDKPIDRSSVIELINSCQLREIYRNGNNEVELLYKDKSNLPADKLKGDTKDYNQYVDGILKVRQKCVIAYRDDSPEVNNPGQVIDWYNITQAKDALLSCSVNRIVVTHEVIPWTNTGELLKGQNTGVLYKETGYKGNTLEIQETIINNDIKPLRTNINKTCGQDAVMWMRDNNQLY